MKRYILPKHDIFEEMVSNTEEYFTANSINISRIPMAVYDDIFSALIIKAFDFILEWKDLPEEELMDTLTWVATHKRNYRTNVTIYEYNKADEQFHLALARFKVQLEKYIIVNFNSEEHKADYIERLMDMYYIYVLDDVEINLKRLLKEIIGDKCWNVFELVTSTYSLELVDYGDYRILFWEKNRVKIMRT